jgi:ATP-dependent helicase HrpB
VDPLPIDPYLERIASAVRERGALVLVAPPGAGKTTRVPPALSDALSAPGRAGGKVLVLQPRRIAACAAAARIAEERGVRLGGEVGYRVRFESRAGPSTRIEVVTDGILLRWLDRDPFLEGVAAVVLDEFHERRLESDLALALLREVRAEARRDLAVVVMSATLAPAPVAKFLGGAPVIEAAGRPYPVEVRYAGPLGPRPLEEAVAEAVRASWSEASGHVLVFLPGAAEIARAARALEGFAARAGARITPLHGRLALDEQQAALRPSRARKIVLSTNVAETSLTIDGVDLVVDSGLARILRNDPRTGIDRLETVRASRHSVEQRAGRAGRQRPGKALRLWSEAEHAALPEAELPEVARVDLAYAVLELRAWGVAGPRRFVWYEEPPSGALERAEALLADLGAIEAPGGPLTELGRRLLAVPAHPRLARLLLAAAEAGRPGDGARLAALIEERDVVRYRPFGPARARRGGPKLAASSDLLLRLELVREAESGGLSRAAVDRDDLDSVALRAVARLARDLERSVGARPRHDDDREDEEPLLRAVLLAYPDRVARRRAPRSDRGRMVSGRGVVLAPESVVRDAELFVALDVDESTRGERLEARVRLASAIEARWLEEEFPRSISERTETWFDEESERVRATSTRLYRDLPLEEPRELPPPPDEARQLLEEAVAARAAEIFTADEAAAAVLARLRFLAEAMPELGLPRSSAEELAALLRPLCAGKTRLDEVRAAGLAALLESALSSAQRAALERHAPERLEVPSGSRIRLAYAAGRPPVLAARVQELFGLRETPRVAAGRVPVLLHILGPDSRPVQVTQDLESFWNTTYHQVRKDLRGRYPKHAWPEDPWSATAERSPRRGRPGGK